MFEPLDILISVYIFCIAVSELMGAKTFPLFSLFGYQLNASVAILVLPLIYTINDVITEVYGKQRTKSIVKSGLVVVILIMIFSILATALPPSSRFVKTELAYDTIFQFSIRISAASLFAFTISEFLDIYIYEKIRKQFGPRRLWLRNNISNFISQGFDTICFISLAFYAFDKPLPQNILFLASLILPYWFLKCCMSIIETPFVYLGVRMLKT